MDLERATDELYGAELDDFVSERTRLAKELRDAGDREGAQALAKLRKPSVAAWGLNQLARRNRREVDLLLDAGHRLREAQAGALTGADREEFEQARKSERDTLSRLGREAEKLLRERGGASATTLNQISESLRAAAISDEGRELLARGRFVQPLGAQGFDVLEQLAASIAPAAKAPSQRRDPEEEQHARQTLKDAKEELRAAERAARDAGGEAQRARREAEQAEREADEARARADAAAAAVAEAEQRLADLR